MGWFEPSTVPGCRTPHVWLTDGRSLYDVHGDGYALLRLDRAVDPTPLLRAAEERGVPLRLIDLEPAEAGAVYIIVNQLDGSGRLYGPTPGPSHDDDGKRLFICETEASASLSEIEQRLMRRAKIDPDLWIVEIENRSGKYDTPI